MLLLFVLVLLLFFEACLVVMSNFNLGTSRILTAHELVGSQNTLLNRNHIVNDEVARAIWKDNSIQNISNKT